MKLDMSAVLMSGDGEKVFGKGPYLLLTGIEKFGSLNAAAKELGMAYTKATAILKRAEAYLGFPLTERSTGGRHGGGSTLTEDAVKLMRAWEAFSEEKTRVSEELYGRYFSWMPKLRLGCVVLASGKSTRFGGNKLLADLGGKPVLARTLSAVPKELFEKVTVVVSDRDVEAVARSCGFDTVFYEGGPVSESIRRGLETVCGTDGCLFVNGDQPLISEKSIRKMAELFREDTARGLRLAYGSEQGSPVLFPSRWYDDLMALTEEKGGMSVVKAKGEVFFSVQAENLAELLDADTPEELAIIRASML